MERRYLLMSRAPRRERRTLNPSDCGLYPHHTRHISLRQKTPVQKQMPGRGKYQCLPATMCVTVSVWGLRTKKNNPFCKLCPLISVFPPSQYPRPMNSLLPFAFLLSTNSNRFDSTVCVWVNPPPSVEPVSGSRSAPSAWHRHAVSTRSLLGLRQRWQQWDVGVSQVPRWLMSHWYIWVTSENIVKITSKESLFGWIQRHISKPC